MSRFKKHNFCRTSHWMLLPIIHLLNMPFLSILIEYNVLFYFKSIFRVRADHLAFSLPKAHSTGFLVIQSKLLKTTSLLLEHVSNSVIQNGIRPVCNFIKKETLAQVFVFSCEFCEISKSTFSYILSPLAASICFH